ncbi:MAG: right-handed parallel beta-helix repeat-containing protein [Candidatus Lokiarchaeota archaeon]|nr:right-handed parallel beta-helix repeat-containing protein [Candidatus Lokiarchaeota archaeon]
MKRYQSILILIPILVGAFIGGFIACMFILPNGSCQETAGETVGNTYYCYTETDINTSLNEIGSGEGTIVLRQNITITSTLVIDGGGDYLIEGVGLYSNTSNTLFISNARSCIIRNLFLEGINLNYMISISNSQNNPVRLENLDMRSKTEYSGIGIRVSSDNVWIQDCQVQNFHQGIYINTFASEVTVQSCVLSHFDDAAFYIVGDFNEIISNTIEDCVTAIGLYSGSYENTILDNDISAYKSAGINMYHSDNNIISGNYIHDNSIEVYYNMGILVGSDSDYNLIINNYLRNLDNPDAGIVAYGVRFTNTYTHYNVVTHNILQDVEIAFNGASTTDTVTENTIFTSP